MSHTLILGVTDCGKTTLAKALAKAYQQRGIGTIVLDPIRDPEWKADFVTADPEAFLSIFWESRCCAVFIDEAGDVVGQYDKPMVKTTTRGRHLGHNVHLLSQRGASMSRTARDQCSNLFLFATARPDAKTHALEWNSPELENASQLPQGHFYFTTRFGACARGRVF